MKVGEIIIFLENPTSSDRINYKSLFGHNSPTLGIEGTVTWVNDGCVGVKEFPVETDGEFRFKQFAWGMPPTNKLSKELAEEFLESDKKLKEIDVPTRVFSLTTPF